MTKATIQKTNPNKNKMLKLYHSRGVVLKAKVSWVKINGAQQSCGNYWINRVRLASDRASTDCWQWPCLVFSLL